MDVRVANEGEDEFTLRRDDAWTLHLQGGGSILAKGYFDHHNRRRHETEVRPHEVVGVVIQLARPLDGTVTGLTFRSAALGRDVEVDHPFVYPVLKLSIPPSQPLPAEGDAPGGQVKLGILVGPDGRALRVDPLEFGGFIKASAAQRQAAVEAAVRWQFEPATEAGIPCAALVVEFVDFSARSVVATVPLPLPETRERLLSLVRDAYPSVVSLVSADAFLAFGTPSGDSRGRSVPMFQVRLGEVEDSRSTWVAIRSSIYNEEADAGPCPCAAWTTDPEAPGALVRWIATGLGFKELPTVAYASQRGATVASGRLEPESAARWNAGALRTLARAAISKLSATGDTPVESFPPITEGEVLRGVGPFDYFPGEATEPVLVDRVEPIYPEEARQRRVQGRVVLEATIDRDGKVDDLRVISSPSATLARAARRAVCCWRYKPATMAGEPIAIYFQIMVEFRLR